MSKLLLASLVAAASRKLEVGDGKPEAGWVAPRFQPPHPACEGASHGGGGRSRVLSGAAAKTGGGGAVLAGPWLCVMGVVRCVKQG